MSLIKRLRCFVVGCNNEYSSHHLLLTSEPLKTQRINVTFVFEGNVPIPDIHKCIYVHANNSSSTEKVSKRVFYESLQIAFPNNVVSQFRSCSLKSARCSTEERGGVSRAH